MDAQVADLQHARDALTKIISAIDRKMRNGFVDTFNAVDKNFREIFGMLFPGRIGPPGDDRPLTTPTRPASRS